MLKLTVVHVINSVIVPIATSRCTRREEDHGKAVQVDPIKPTLKARRTNTLKARGTKRLKLGYDKMLSSFAFNCNLRRYTTASACGTRPVV
jgi:hypothetical protein